MTAQSAPEGLITVAGAFSHLNIAPSHAGPFAIQPGFRVSQDRVGDYELLDSFVATPSRYVLEMLRRTRQNQRDVRRILVFNPLLRLSTYLIRYTLARVAQSAATDVVVRSSNQLPLAYLLTLDPTDDYRHLLLLSCSDPELDRQLLAALYCTQITTVEVPFPCHTVVGNGFLPGPYLRPMEWCANNAIAVLQAAQAVAPDADRREVRDAIRLSAFFTHHAGDALFMGIAARQTAQPLYDDLLIHETYCPIVGDIAGKIRVSSVSGPVPFRGDYRKEDCYHFIDMAPNLPKGVFHVYCRTTRNYNFTNFHYIDHFRFCLGEPLVDESQLHRGQVAEASDSDKVPRPGPARLLLHFDAGWPLKIYPQALQVELVKRLQGSGYQVTVLDAKDSLPGVNSRRFGTLEAFDELLDDIDVLIGMDSFPAHYAAQAKHIKTIHLFSSTHPVHSWAGDSGRHRALHNGAICCPCLGWDTCIRHGGPDCRNFAAPVKVVSALAELLAATPLLPIKPYPIVQPATRCPRQYQRPTGKAIHFQTAHLVTTRLRVERPFWYVAIIPGAVRLLVAEFVNTLRHEGLRKAVYLTQAFLYRHLSQTPVARGRKGSP